MFFFFSFFFFLAVIVYICCCKPCISFLSHHKINVALHKSCKFRFGLPLSRGRKKKKRKCALPGNRTRVARMGILHDTTTLAVLTSFIVTNVHTYPFPSQKLCEICNHVTFQTTGIHKRISATINVTSPVCSSTLAVVPFLVCIGQTHHLV